MDLYKLGWEAAKGQVEYEEETDLVKRKKAIEEHEQREDDPDFDRDREEEDLADWEDDSNEM